MYIWYTYMGENSIDVIEMGIKNYFKIKNKQPLKIWIQ